MRQSYGHTAEQRSIQDYPEHACDDVCLGRLLLVDDEPCSLVLWKQIFESAGYSVTPCCTPEDAVRYDMQAFDLAIIDFDMPGCDGRTLFLKMRALHAAFPVILLSGSTEALSPETRILFSRCISKPAACGDLIAAVAAFLTRDALPDCC